MRIFLGDRQKALTLLTLYGLENKADFVLAPHSGDAADIENAFILGGEWTYQTILEELGDKGIDRQKILLGTEPDRVHRTLLKHASADVDLPRIGYQSVYHDVFERAWYAYPMILATALCVRLRIPEFCAIEFGVFTGNGLRNMASLAEFIKETIGIKIKVVGFDTGAGIPSVADWRDHPELWAAGELVMPDVGAIRRSLPEHASLVIGDIRDTLESALEASLSADCPLGFVVLDVDTYSSSVAALRVFDQRADFLLPVVPMYVDDAYVNISQTSFAGEGLAISEFNDTHPLRKIDRKIVRTDRMQMPWHHTMYFAHIFDHIVRTSSGTTNLNGLYHFYF